MIGIIIALFVGYYLGKNEKQDQKQTEVEYTGAVEYNGMNYGYVKDGESVRDLT
ncbi:MAG: hypothetical protein KGI19_07195 [Thaumarchaeota archaeon]|nr:hypothetical protein [Nitrososphaerota archaeon]